MMDSECRQWSADCLATNEPTKSQIFEGQERQGSNLVMDKTCRPRANVQIALRIMQGKDTTYLIGLNMTIGWSSILPYLDCFVLTSTAHSSAVGAPIYGKDFVFVAR